MPFESKPLRVHLHCDTNASAVVSPPTTFCVHVHSVPPTYYPVTGIRFCDAFFTHHCGYFFTIPQCHEPTYVEYGPMTGILGAPGTPQEMVMVQHDEEDQTTISMRLQDLPVYIKALDDELRRHEEVAERKGEIEERLEEARAIMKEAREAAGGEADAGEQTEA